ncbi:MAG: NAD(P)H-dependent oxidoreductase subunit E [Bacteroidetes bacterium]|nr:NAD(P)H-dependent oxidoreductase subunit E [Bacteroidota bacterium]MBL7105042.1 NAD(P)H-dependent oxidoreductase subunit E [Bacteroidales bacterium]
MNEEIINIVDKIIAEKGKNPDAVIPVLQEIQNAFNYLPEDALKRLCDNTEITPSQVYGISTFYTQFRHKPVGQHIIKVCVGTACHVKGAMQVFDAFTRELNLKEGEDTDAEGRFTLDKIACLGCCTIAPVVQIDDVTYGHVNTEKVTEILEDFLQGSNKHRHRRNLRISKSKIQGEIRIGLGSCCIASGSSEVKEELENTLNSQNIHVDIKHVGCVGICNQVPLMEIHKPGETPSFYAKIKPEEVKGIITNHFKSASPVDRLINSFYNFFENIVLENTPITLRRYEADKRDTPVSEFLKGQINIATEYRGEIKPSDLEEYKRLGGFLALQKCLSKLSAEQTIKTIIQAGLRGRGGAGFPTGIKWEIVYKTKSVRKFVICNGDEGDPGAFMDRMLLESYPYRIIEGVIIAAYAVGASEGLFYIRAEYPLAVARIKEAIRVCREENILGENILNSGFSFHLKVFEGAGAFVCGEETALIASVEGKRGMPSIRPPYPAIRGLWGKPTLINNTETFSLIPWIIRNGADAFNKTGSEDSKGTKVFALAGKINRGGLIEVPMGISIRTIVEEIGGGIPNGKKFKAVQIGGPSGGCIPASMADTPIDFESLKEAGAMMGSGGLVVLDETDCMIDIARYFLSFTQDQSCGKCTFCRIGTRKMLERLNKITSGNGTEKDLVQLEQLAQSTKKGSLCGLGKTAPNPVLSTLFHFREEYEEHIKGHCPTGKCTDMIVYDITKDCNGCTKCAQRCPTEAIVARPYEIHTIDTEKCIKCDICRQVCPVDAVRTVSSRQ